MSFLSVAIGGFFGSILRFYISVKANKHLIGTWIANITGSILLAIAVYYQQDGLLTEWMWALFGVGFCGAYTTFSTFGNETLQLIFDKKYWTAAGYIAGSLAVSLLAVYLVLI
ncbi:chromosome condensation protein CrcB [Virgibacillus dakarensis]|uniref:Fluoride-specific ion channel FluC n=1 Tax=Lentibacillus populi TaxID=1827502 RepID=A0A9W5TW12_9BACI|nr:MULTISPECIES: CrcB family protein [Bacillaceae]MBT2217612.1 CrcB family protein [Virgibacillus dakarensis]MTW84732.1 chromosome condensation protein CrcB [Virgibacillus dakarensis]GGB36258.1 putative fluoride ion transporter CrcB 2 [Lentibacillus populi]